MYEKLLEPINIGKVQLKNRIFAAPMTAYNGIEGGFLSDRIIEYYADKAKGGWGLVCVEAAYVRDDGFCYPRFLGAASDNQFLALKEVADTIHNYGAKCAIQLVHGGRGAVMGVTGKQPVAPSETTPEWPPGGAKPKGLSLEEADELINCFVASAMRAVFAGYDIILLHSAHGFLLSQFQSRYTNHRTDKYGPETAFTVELIKRVKQVVGDVPVGMRISCDEFVPGGITLEQNLRMLPEFEAAGLDYIDINAGSRETRERVIPPIYLSPGVNVYAAEAIKKVVNIPVVIAGRLQDPEIANKVIEEGKADIVSMGRQTFADPSLPKKVTEGRPEDIIPCITCGFCTSGRHAISQCAVNFDFNKPARDTEYRRADTPKNVLVVGGGPGGMEAARVAAKRGHKVTLWERTSDLGGAIIPAAVPDFKKEFNRLISYQVTQMKKLGVKVELGKEATLASVEAFKPDSVIIATGGLSKIPDIPGLDKQEAITAVDVLMGKKEIGQSVLIRGGGLTACDTALHLIRQGKKVTMVTSMDKVGQGFSDWNLRLMMQLLDDGNTRILTKSKTVEMNNNGLIVKDEEGKIIHVEADSVVIAVGYNPDNKLYEDLKEKMSEVYAIGDCVKPRYIADAIWEGARIARQV